MATLVSTSKGKKYHLFLNISFLLLLSFYLTIHLHPSHPHLHNNQYSKKPVRSPSSSQSPDDSSETCSGFHRFNDYTEKCFYVTSEARCQSEGYINYLQLFYCFCGRYPVVFGYSILILWLLLLFYLLGNTAANYFCSSLEGLSRILNLSPTIAGVTLLSLGNGAPDAFSSVVSFIGTSTGGVGLNSILGGAFFVSSVVTGIISICIGSSKISVDKPSFIRDVCFLIIALSALVVIIIVGKINIWGATAFTSLYFVYVFFVSATHFCRKEGPLLLVNCNIFSRETEKHNVLVVPLLPSIEADESILTVEEGMENDWKKPERSAFRLSSSASYYFGRAVYFLELPLYLPRRLTIPDVSEERWCKPFAVASVTFAPLLLAFLWNSQRGDMDSKSSSVVYLIGGLVGMILGIAAFVTTEKSSPPRRFLLPWLGSGFLMSVVWTYITAEELVSLLVSIGAVLGMSPSILGLTVLAWGNSLGDLITNVLMAINGGPDGTQVAISGCYGAPIFNTLVGLGASLVFSSWREYPSSYSIPEDPSLYQTLGFLVGGLLWALVILPGRGMRLDRVLGVGLLAIYLCFLSLRLSQALGLLQLPGFLGPTLASPSKP